MMSPNAMGNAQAGQIAQLEEMKKKIDQNAEVSGRVVEHLKSSRESSARVAIGYKDLANPTETTDLEWIASAISELSYAQLIMANHSLSELKAQSLLLDEAIAKAKSPIAQAKIHVPRLS